MNVDIGKRIKDLRKSLGLPCNHFADAIFFNVKTIYRWESNQTVPTVKDIQLISETFGIDIAYFYVSDEKAADLLSDFIPSKGTQKLNKKSYIFPISSSFALIFSILSISLLVFSIVRLINIDFSSNNTANNVVLRYTATSNVCIVLFVISFLSLSIASVFTYIAFFKKYHK